LNGEIEIFINRPIHYSRRCCTKQCISNLPIAQRTQFIQKLYKSCGCWHYYLRGLWYII